MALGGKIMGFYELIDKYGKGASDAKMKELTCTLDKFFEMLKDAHREKYKYLMREVFGVLNNHHYDEHYAEKDISCMEYTDRTGVKRKGGHWTLEEAEEQYKKLQVPSSVGKYDWWVAINASFADMCTVLDDDSIIKSALLFWFKDEDWKGDTKIFDYFTLKMEKDMLK